MKYRNPSNRLNLIDFTKSLLLLLVVLVAGCSPRMETTQRIIERDDGEYVVTMLFDLSGSFDGMMCEGGVAYEFALQAIQKYFRDRIGTNDKLVIAQISGIDRALLWEGTPHQLRKQFPSARAFAAFLRSKSHPAGSCVHKAIADSVEYILDKPHKRSAVLVISDMLDTGPQDGRTTALEVLGKFATRNGVVGLYYVDPKLVSGWKADLQSAGFNEFCVESAIVARPTLPSFED